MKIIWCMVPEIWSTRDVNFCYFGPFVAFYRPNNPKKVKILKNWEKKPADIIVLHLFFTNDDHMVYGFLDVERDRHNFLSFWTIFALLPPWQPKKYKFWKNWKRILKISSFYTCVTQTTIIWCILPEIWSVTDRISCHFGSFFPFCPTNNLKNQNFEKLKK